MTKKYLNGTLSPSEMYEVEDRLLESDFYFEAMEGLEKIPWDLCEKAVETTKERIVNKYRISKKQSGVNMKVLMASLAVLMAAAGFWWIVKTETSETYDLSPSNPEIQPSSSNLSPSSANLNNSPVDSATSKVDSSQTAKSPPENTSGNPAVGSSENEGALTTNSANYVAVGRIINKDGQAIENVKVSTGAISDTTDKSGYYALRVEPGNQTLTLSYGEFTADVNVNTSQNWEIVLDPGKSEIIGSYPITGANRFK